jgi:putative Ca2+/H+ antiporter (TMEM165/GDT1 family)
MLETFVTTTGLVAIAEIGDKTQLLSILLAARFARPVPILFGILLATVLNHALASLAGVFIGGQINEDLMRMAVGIAFLAVGIWTLFPDKADENALRTGDAGVFMATFIAFMIAETGDKTQIATSLLAARHQDAVIVTAASTVGMMLANIPAVLLGDQLLRRTPLALVRRIAAVGFLLVGTITLMPYVVGLAGL